MTLYLVPQTDVPSGALVRLLRASGDAASTSSTSEGRDVATSWTAPQARYADPGSYQLEVTPSGGATTTQPVTVSSSGGSTTGPATTTGGSGGTGTGGTAGVSSFQGRTGAVTLSKGDVTGTGLAATDVGALTPAAASATYPTIVDHGTVGATARPSTALRVFWRGSATPANATVGDRWIDLAVPTAPVERIVTSIGPQVFAALSGGAPVFNERGAFAPSTAYAAGDVFTAPNGDRVLVKTAYTSGATYSAGANTITLSTAGGSMALLAETVVTAISGATGGVYSQASTTPVAVPGISVTSVFPTGGVLYIDLLTYLAHSTGGSAKYAILDLFRTDTSAVVDQWSLQTFATGSAFQKAPLRAKLTGTAGASVTVTARLSQSGGGSAQIYADVALATFLRASG